MASNAPVVSADILARVDSCCERFFTSVTPHLRAQADTELKVRAREQNILCSC